MWNLNYKIILPANVYSFTYFVLNPVPLITFFCVILYIYMCICMYIYMPIHVPIPILLSVLLWMCYELKTIKHIFYIYVDDHRSSTFIIYELIHRLVSMNLMDYINRFLHIDPFSLLEFIPVNCDTLFSPMSYLICLCPSHIEEEKYSSVYMFV